MNVIKGAWVGQTFALATCNDSGGKKSRIRRSKEERKSMVESYIQRYQKMNNGNFPSLNLTHKEVGGSFYTVREIVREVIQENRVLGPAKLSVEEQNDYAFLEQYPLGSIYSEPHTRVFTSEETSALTNLNQGTSEEHVLDSNGKFYESEDDKVVNSNSVELGTDRESEESSITLSMSIADEKTSEFEFLSSSEQFVYEDTILIEEESYEPTATDALTILNEETSIKQLQSCSKELPQSEFSFSSSADVASGSIQKSLTYEESHLEEEVESLVQESLGNKKDGVKEQDVLKAGLTQMTADVVETFPLRPVSATIHGLDVRSGESSEISNPLEEKKTKEDRLNSLQNGSVSRNEKDQVTQEVLEVEKNKEIMDENDVLAALLESTNGSPIQESIMPEHSGNTNLHKASSPAETKPVMSPNGIHHENLNSPITSGSAKQETPVETTSNPRKLEVQHDSSSSKGSSPTLNTINPEKSDGKSRKSAEPEANPILASLKAFITAFVKFWTE